MADDNSDKGAPTQSGDDDNAGSATGGLGGVDAGTPGGMGGAGVSGGTGTDRPPGGLSPLLAHPHNETTSDDEG